MNRGINKNKVKKLHSSIMTKTILYTYVHFLEKIFSVFVHNWQSDNAKAGIRLWQNRGGFAPRNSNESFCERPIGGTLLSPVQNFSTSTREAYPSQ